MDAQGPQGAGHQGQPKYTGKVAVMGLLERHSDGSRVRLAVVPGNRRHQLMPHIHANVEAGSTLYADSLPPYNGLGREYIHNVSDHAEKYDDGQVHTDGLEHFWALLKRALKGTYYRSTRSICFAASTSKRFVATSARARTPHSSFSLSPQSSIAV